MCVFACVGAYGCVGACVGVCVCVCACVCAHTYMKARTNAHTHPPISKNYQDPEQHKQESNVY